MTKKSKQKKSHANIAQRGQDKKAKENEMLQLITNYIKNRFDLLLIIIMLLGLALLLFLGPYFRGLFFPQELLTAQIAIFGLLIIWGLLRLYKKDSLLPISPMDICFFFLLLAYAVSFQFAVNKRDALEEVLKIAAYIVVYLVVIDICRYFRLKAISEPGGVGKIETTKNDNQGVNLILNIMVLAGLVIAVVSIGGAIGNWWFIGAYDGNRVASPMGYANTAAAYFMASYLLSLGILPLANRWYKLAYLASGMVFLLIVILTFSRGAWLFLPPLVILMVVLSQFGERLRTLLNFIATAVIAVPLAFIIDPIIRSDTPNRAWLFIILGLILVSGIGLLIEQFFLRSKRFRVHSIAAISGLIFLIILSVVVLPLMRPIFLEKGSGLLLQRNTVKQIVYDLASGTDSFLYLEVDAGIVNSVERENSDGEYWGVRIIGATEDYGSTQLLEYRGTLTDGWENMALSFLIDEKSERYEVQLYLLSDDAYLAVNNVKIVSGDHEEKLLFLTSRILPQRFYDRVFSFSRERNIDRRYEIFQDAIKIIRDYPLTGTGGGGFAALYHAYQDQFYYSREVHNHYLQAWVEAGIIGFLAFVGIWFSLILAYFKNILKKDIPSQERQLWTASFMPVIALGAHSMIDWNFSLAAVGLFLFVLFGVIKSLDRVTWFRPRSEKNLDSKYHSWLIGIGALIAGAALLVFSLFLLAGFKSTMVSQDLIVRGNLKTASLEMENAMWQDPYRASSFHNLSVLAADQFKRTGNEADLNQAFKLAERACELEPYNPAYLTHYGNLLLQYGDYQKGLLYIDRVVEVRPFDRLSYSNAIIYRLLLAETFLSVSNRFEANKYFDGIFAVERKMIDKYGSMPLNYEIGRAYFLLEEVDMARIYFELVEDDNRHYEAAQDFLLMIGNER